MEDNSNLNTCDRVDDLIGLLYGELSESEVLSCERHLRECVACEAEFTAFGQIRESMVEWRNESLGLATLPTAAAGERSVTVVAQSSRPTRSAVAALREFFALSPFWMKGATAFAGVVFCVCAVLAVGYLKDRAVTDKALHAPSGKVYTPQELEQAVAVARDQVRQEMRAKEKQSPDDLTIDFPAPKSPQRSRPASPVAGNSRRPFTPRERQELAADLRLVTSLDDDDLDLNIDPNHP